MFQQDTYTGSEGGAPVMICAEITALMDTLDCDLVVTFFDNPGIKAGMTVFFLLIKCFLFLHNTVTTSSQPEYHHACDASLSTVRKPGTFLVCNGAKFGLVLWGSTSCTTFQQLCVN